MVRVSKHEIVMWKGHKRLHSRTTGEYPDVVVELIDAKCLILGCFKPILTMGRSAA